MIDDLTAENWYATPEFNKSRASQAVTAASCARISAMRPVVQIRDGLDGFVVHVKEPGNLGHVLLSIAACLVSLYLFWHTADSRILQIIAACGTLLLFGRGVLSKWKGTDVELCVTNLDFISNGRSPTDYKPSIIPRADIYGLQYREAQHGGAELPDLPEGLYVDYTQGMPWNGSACVLPHVGREQTERIIQRILHRFPDTGTLASRPAERSRLICLNLEAPDH